MLLRSGVLRGNLLLAVRPVLPALASITPIKPSVLLPSVSLASWWLSAWLCYKYASTFYSGPSPIYAVFLTLLSFPVILAGGAPMADVPALAAGLAVLLLVVPRVLRGEVRVKGLIPIGLASGALVLVRENVAASLLAVALVLLLKSKFKEAAAYLLCGSVAPILWTSFSATQLGLTYLSNIQTGVQISLAYSGLYYNPLRVVKYLLVGLGPLALPSIFAWLITGGKAEEFKLLHALALPHVLLAALWPGMYEPRLAIIAMPGVAPIVGEGFMLLLFKFSQLPIYGRLGLSALERGLLALYFIYNLALAYLNNSLRISGILAHGA